MDEKRLQEIKQRAEAATPGPWSDHRGEVNYLTCLGYYHLLCTGEDMSCGDAEFIAHARTDIPYLIGEIEQLKELLDFNANLNAKIIVDMGRVSTENDNLRTEIERLMKIVAYYADRENWGRSDFSPEQAERALIKAVSYG